MKYIKYLVLAAVWMLTWFNSKSIVFNILLGLTGIWIIADAIRQWKEVSKHG